MADVQADVSDPAPAAAEAFEMPAAPEVSEEAKAEQRARLAAEAKAEAAAAEEAEAQAKAAAAEEERAKTVQLVNAAIAKGTVKAVSAADFGVLEKAASLELRPMPTGLCRLQALAWRMCRLPPAGGVRMHVNARYTSAAASVRLRRAQSRGQRPELYMSRSLELSGSV